MATMWPFGGRTQEVAARPEETDTEDSLVRFVEDEFRRRQEERRPFELQWRLNIAFIEGHQYVDVNAAAGILEEVPKLFWWQEREVFNHIASIVETRIAKLNRMRPILKSRPGSNQQEDLRAAKVASQLLRNIYYDQGIQKLMSEAFAWEEANGSVLFKHVWDRQKGKVIAELVAMATGEAGDEVTGETGSRELLYEGDLDVVVVPPQEFYPDSSYRQGVEQCRSVIHARAYHIDEIEETWGVRVNPEQTSAIQLQKSMVAAGGLGYIGGGFHYVTSQLKDHAVVKEYWERPGKRFPRGRLIIVGGGKLLYKGDLPYPVDEDGRLGLPFTKLDCIKRPGVFWGRSIVERLIPIQRRYNALRNRKAEYLNRVAIGQWNVEEGSVDPDIFEAEAGAPGAIHEYKKGYAPPQPVKNEPLPAAFETEEQNLLYEFNAISGVSELSRQSNAPPGVKSGVALSIALEQDDTRLSTTASNVEQFLVESGRMWLRLYKTFAQGPRTLRVIGNNNLVEFLDWSGADIKSDDVMIEAFSALAESPAQRRQMVFDLLNTPLAVDPDTGRMSKEVRAKFLEMLEFGNWEDLDDDDQLHSNKAERENRMLAQGMFPQAVNYDDHILHVARHNKFRLTTDYEELLSQNPQIDFLFQQHVDQHLQFLVKSMAPTAPQFMPQGGGGPASSNGEQPEGNKP